MKGAQNTLGVEDSRDFWALSGTKNPQDSTQDFQDSPKKAQEKLLIDPFFRRIDYLRVSLTKNCNFRCRYCMPNTPDEIKENLIPLPQLLEFLKIAMDYGVKKIRLTGGEPLLREGLCDFIAGIYEHKNNVEVALTTNGFLLQKLAKPLKAAGLKRINVSLDSLRPEKIIKISQRDALEAILAGLEAAKAAGLAVKLNMVPLKGLNDDEIIALLDFANKNGYLLRYIEFMENAFAAGVRGLKSAEILEKIHEKYRTKILAKENFGPAKLYEIMGAAEGAEGNFGESRVESRGKFWAESGESFGETSGESLANLANPSEKSRPAASESSPNLAINSPAANESPKNLAHQTAAAAKNDAKTPDNAPKTPQKPAAFGIIAPHSDDFCLSCNRIRLSAEGVIYPCLYFEDAVDASAAIRSGDRAAMESALLKSVQNKPEKNKWSAEETSRRAFYHTGG